MPPRFVLALVLLAGACASAARSVPKASAELREELLAADRAFCAAAQERSLAEAYRTFMAEGALAMQNGQPIHGRDSVLASFADVSAGERVTWVPLFADASADGDLGYTHGTFEQRTPVADGATQISRGQYVTIWKRYGGTWKVVFDAGNLLSEETMEPK